MAIFVISNLETQDFAFENIRFEGLTYGTTIEKQWRDQHRATFKAMADDNLDVKPIINNGGLRGVIHDVCLLLSLAQSRMIYCPYYEIGGADTQRFSSPRGNLTGDKLVLDNKIESYLSAASHTLRRPRWVEKTGFIPSTYYLLERYHHEPGGIGFMLTWISLEILANTYARKHRISKILPRSRFNIVKQALVSTLSQIEGSELPDEHKNLVMQKVPELNHLSIRGKISKLRDAYGWDFVPDKLLDDCTKVRNHLMHLGTYGNFDLEMPNLYIRLAISVQLALIDLLGCSDYVHNLQDLKIQIKGDEE